MQYTQLARELAGVQQGTGADPPHALPTLYTALVAPAWALAGDAHASYQVAREIGVVAMLAVVFPAYGLARMVASPRASLFASIGCALVPALAYSSMVIEEPLAYTYFALALLATCKAFVVRSPGWIVASVAFVGAAVFVRAELLVLPVAVAAVLAVEVLLARGPGRRTFVVGTCLALALALVFLDRYSHSWQTAEARPWRAVEYAAWALGALTVGVGIVPLIACVDALARPSMRLRPISLLFAATALGFLVYTGVKATYLSTFEMPLVEERNLIYLCPLLLIGTAAWLDRMPRRRTPTIAAAVLALVLVVVTPFHLGLTLYSDALGLSNLQYASHRVGLGGAPITAVLAAVVVVFAAVAVAPVTRRRSVIAAGTALFVLGWCATGELAAGSASNEASNSTLAVPVPSPAWLETATGDRPTLYLASDLDTLAGVYATEFWDREIQGVMKLSGSAPDAPGVVSASLAAASGLLAPRTDVRYVLADPGVRPVGRVISRQRYWTLYEVVPPLRLVDQTTGLKSDGWMSRWSSYALFSGSSPARIRVLLTRSDRVTRSAPVTFTVSAGPLVVRDGQATFLQRTFVRHLTLRAGTKAIAIPRLATPVLVTVSADASDGATAIVRYEHPREKTAAVSGAGNRASAAAGDAGGAHP